MSTIFPLSASVGQVFNGYTFNGTSWDINGIDLTANYPEITDGKISASVIPDTFATVAYVNQEIGSIDLSSASVAAVAAIVDSAPSTLNTLNELAAALGDDANYATTVSTALGNKLDSSTAESTYQPIGSYLTLSGTETMSNKITKDLVFIDSNDSNIGIIGEGYSLSGIPSLKIYSAQNKALFMEGLSVDVSAIAGGINIKADSLYDDIVIESVKGIILDANFGEALNSADADVFLGTSGYKIANKVIAAKNLPPYLDAWTVPYDSINYFSNGITVDSVFNLDTNGYYGYLYNQNIGMTQWSNSLKHTTLPFELNQIVEFKGVNIYDQTEVSVFIAKVTAIELSNGYISFEILQVNNWNGYNYWDTMYNLKIKHKGYDGISVGLADNNIFSGSNTFTGITYFGQYANSSIEEQASVEKPTGLELSLNSSNILLNSQYVTEIKGANIFLGGMYSGLSTATNIRLAATETGYIDLMAPTVNAYAEVLKIGSMLDSGNSFNISYDFQNNIAELNSPGVISLVSQNYGVVYVGSATSGNEIATHDWVENVASIPVWQMSDTEWSGFDPNLKTQFGTISIGNGSVNCAYKQIGKTVHVRYNFTIGSTTSIGGGAIVFGLPVTAANSDYNFAGAALDNGSAWYQIVGVGRYLGSTTEFCVIHYSGSGKSSQGMSNNSLFDLLDGDYITISGTYEAA